MTGRRTLLVVASVLCSALGTALLWLYVQGADARAEADAGFVSVLVAAGTMEAGTPAGALTTRSLDVRSGQAEGLVRSPAEVAGLVLVTRAAAGQPLARAMFGSKPAADVGTTNVAVSVTVTDARRVPALLQAGQDVAVYVVSADRCPSLILPRARVARVGAVAPVGTSVQPGQQVATQIVSFDVTPTDALTLLALKPDDDVALALLGATATPKPSTCGR